MFSFSPERRLITRVCFFEVFMRYDHDTIMPLRLFFFALHSLLLLRSANFNSILLFSFTKNTEIPRVFEKENQCG